MEQRESTKEALRIVEALLQLQLKSVRQLLGEEAMPKRRRRTGLRRESLIDQSISILDESQVPMHVTEIVKILQDQYGRITDRDAISSALGKKVKQGVLLCQPAPATFALLAKNNSGKETR